MSDTGDVESSPIVLKVSMIREHWVNLFQKLPEAIHDQIVFSLSTGIDVYNQRFLQFADEHLLIRGRLGGTDEAERIFMVPWSELKMIFFSRPVEDEMLFRVFGDLIGGVRKSMSAKSKQDEEDEMEEEEEERRPQPMRLPVASVQALAEASAPKQAPNMDELRSRLLQPRKVPPKTQTNKPGTDNKPAAK